MVETDRTSPRFDPPSFCRLPRPLSRSRPALHAFFTLHCHNRHVSLVHAILGVRASPEQDYPAGGFPGSHGPGHDHDRDRLIKGERFPDQRCIRKLHALLRYRIGFTSIFPVIADRSVGVDEPDRSLAPHIRHQVSAADRIGWDECLAS